MLYQEILNKQNNGSQPVETKKSHVLHLVSEILTCQIEENKSSSLKFKQQFLKGLPKRLLKKSLLTGFYHSNRGYNQRYHKYD